MKFDADSLAEDPSLILRALGFMALLFVVRGLPALLVYRGVLVTRMRTALALLQSTALPLIVVITEIGTSTGRMHQDNATALVAAGMLSVLVYPLAGFAVLGDNSVPGDDASVGPPDGDPAIPDAAQRSEP